MVERFFGPIRRILARRAYRKITESEVYQNTVNKAVELGRKGGRNPVATIIEDDGTIRTRVLDISPSEKGSSPELTVGERFDISFGPNLQRRKMSGGE